jgi:hypothetical protein
MAIEWSAADPFSPSAIKGAMAKKSATPALLAGGNPRIAKGDGNAPVCAYIAAMPGWKRDIGRGLDRLIVETVPNVRKAVKWNTPLYGLEGCGWFLGYHCLTNSVKVLQRRCSKTRATGRTSGRTPRTMPHRTTSEIRDDTDRLGHGPRRPRGSRSPRPTFSPGGRCRTR